MKKSAALLALVLGGLLPGCGPSTTTTDPKNPTWALEVAMTGRVGRYLSTPSTFSTNSFVIEGPEGIVLIDAQFTPQQATRFLIEAERATRKRAALAVVLHANPDKFNGTETLQKRGVKVVTSKQVAAAIPAVFRERTAAFKPRYAPDWPNATPAPDTFGDKTTELDVAGTRLRLHVLGAGCSTAHVVVEWDADDGKHVFVGDLVGNGVHAWLELGLVDEWLARLAEIRALRPKFVHPGRGNTGGIDLIDVQAQYLKDVERFVAAERPVMPPPPLAFDRVRGRMRSVYPKYDFEAFLDRGLPAVWERQAKALAR